MWTRPSVPPVARIAGGGAEEVEGAGLGDGGHGGSLGKLRIGLFNRNSDSELCQACASPRSRYTVLVLVGRDGAGPHDLRRMADIGRVYWDAAPSQWYAEPKRLAEHGYLEARKGPGPHARAHPLHAHRARPRGARGVGAHARDAAADPERAGRAAARRRPRPAGGRARGARGDARRPRCRAAPASSGPRARPPALAHRAHLLEVNHRYAERFLALQREWLEEAERVLSDASSRSSRPPS